MKTNGGRKLLIESEDEGELGGTKTGSGGGHHNLGYESDLSDLSAARSSSGGPSAAARRGNLPTTSVVGRGLRRTDSQSSSTTLDSASGGGGKPRLVRSDTGGSWELRGTSGDSVDLDRVDLESGNFSRHVR